jgi:Peptidase family M23
LILVVATGGGEQPDASSNLSDEPTAVPSLPAQAGQGETPSPQAPIADETPSTAAGAAFVIKVEQGHAFLWPANGSVATAIAPFHRGIDIALQSRGGTAVRATARGTVTFVGSDADVDLGTNIVIDHGGGLSSVYGHLERVLVSRGQTVEQGESIGMAGTVGGSDSRRLHFEVNHGGSQIDPLKLLPAQYDSPSSLAQIDCGAHELVNVDSGTPLRLDFSEALDPDAIVARVDLEDRIVSPDAPAVDVSLTSTSSAVLESEPSVVDSGQSVYTLIVETRQSSSRERFACTVIVRTRTVEPSSFFVAPTQSQEPTPTGSSSTPPPGAAPTQAPTQVPTQVPLPPTPTKTPFPTS